MSSYIIDGIKYEVTREFENEGKPIEEIIIDFFKEKIINQKEPA